jgi:hypothetical protein
MVSYNSVVKMISENSVVTMISKVITPLYMYFFPLVVVSSLSVLFALFSRVTVCVCVSSIQYVLSEPCVVCVVPYVPCI